MTRGRMTRRDALGLVGTSLVALPSLPRLAGRSQDPQEPLPGSPFKVALIPCPDYNIDRLREALSAGWHLSVAPEIKGKRIVIKPNMVDVSADRPVHTNPNLIEALVLLLGDLGAREIILAEGTSHIRDSEWLFRQAGYEAIAKRRGIGLVDLNYDDLETVRCTDPRATLLRDMFLPRTIVLADTIISIPKMKTHKLAGITLSLKNMFGILPGTAYGWPKNPLHWNGIPRSICEINGTVRTHYSIVDGIIGMEGHGPIMGKARKVGVLVMGANALSVDATAARVMGINPARVDYLVMAQKLRIGSLRFPDIELLGERLERVRQDFLLDHEYAFLKGV